MNRLHRWAEGTESTLDDEAVDALAPPIRFIPLLVGIFIAVGYLGLDVYEEESDLFFHDCSDKVIQDDVFARLLTFPNVLITGHQAFLTEEALRRSRDASRRASSSSRGASEADTAVRATERSPRASRAARATT